MRALQLPSRPWLRGGRRLWRRLQWWLRVARPPRAARWIQQRLGNQGSHALGAQVVARACSSCSSAGGSGASGLTLSQPGDAHEREAESVADNVMRMPEPGVQREVRPGLSAGTTLLHRSAKEPGPSEISAPVAANIRNMQGGGAPLPDTTRAFFEPRFGADLGHVRVHTGVQAAQTAESISAKAFTVGSDIAFADGARTLQRPTRGRSYLRTS